MKFILSLLLFLSAPLVAKSEKTTKSEGKIMTAGQIIEKLQKSWDAAETYQAKFTQIIFQKGVGTREEATGLLSVKKPGRLRWEQESDGLIQIFNDKKFLVITTNKRRGTTVVDIYKDASKVADSQSLSFLSGKSKFREIYRIELLSDENGVAKLKFTPKVVPDDSLVAEIDKESYLLRSLTSESVDSRVRTEFTDTKVNPKLDERLFDYKPGPKDVVHNN